MHDHTDAAKALIASITSNALENIKNDLTEQNLTDIKYKICIMHHHPVKHSNINNVRDTDSLNKGDALIKLLSDFSFDIVVHGHKHQPRIKEEGAIAILAAGSFSCFANLQNTGYQQMFHVIDIEESDTNKKGQINSWEYTTLYGWRQNENIAFPARIGYGAKLNIDDTANTIYEMLTENGKTILFEDVVTRISDIKYLTPDNLIEVWRISPGKNLPKKTKNPQD